MSSEAAVMVESSEVLTAPTVMDETKMQVRWIIQAALRDKPLDARLCGMPKAPFGRFKALKPFVTPKENCSIDWTQPKEQLELVPAADAEKYIKEALGGQGAQNRTNWGVQVGFMDEKDAVKMAVISDTVMPKLSVIRAICADLGVNAISPICEGSDDLDYEEREMCVSCWNRWLQSPAIDSYIERVALEGRSVTVRNPETGEYSTVVGKPTVAELKAGKDMANKAVRQAIRELENQWRQIAAEAEQPGRAVSPFEHEYRKDLHMVKPEERQNAFALEMLKGIKSGDGDSTQILAALAQSTIETQTMMRQMMGGQKALDEVETESVEQPKRRGRPPMKPEGENNES